MQMSASILSFCARVSEPSQACRGSGCFHEPSPVLLEPMAQYRLDVVLNRSGFCRGLLLVSCAALGEKGGAKLVHVSGGMVLLRAA